MSAFATAVQAIPAAAIAPASACASAIHYTFLGLRNRSFLFLFFCFFWCLLSYCWTHNNMRIFGNLVDVGSLSWLQP